MKPHEERDQAAAKQMASKVLARLITTHSSDVQGDSIRLPLLFLARVLERAVSEGIAEGRKLGPAPKVILPRFNADVPPTPTEP